MCSRTGSFPPSLARYFILHYSAPGDKVLDPFSGKGTAPLEACIHGRIGIGNDIAPEAYVLTHAKVRPVTLKGVKVYLKSLKVKMIKQLKNCSIDEVSDDVRIFFHPKTLKQIVALREILKDEKSDSAIFIKALMCGILHGALKISLSLRCSHLFSMSPNYVRKYSRKHKLRRPYKRVIDCLMQKADEILADGLPKVKGKAYNKDVAHILPKEKVDLIITSPPYFKAQTYAWDNWLRLWFLGHNYKEIDKLLFQTESKQKYVNTMFVYMKKMHQALKDNSTCFVVVGDVNIKGKKVRTAELLVEPAQLARFEVKRIIVDEFPQNNRFSNSKYKRIDRILELRK